MPTAAWSGPPGAVHQAGAESHCSRSLIAPSKLRPTICSSKAAAALSEWWAPQWAEGQARGAAPLPRAATCSQQPSHQSIQTVGRCTAARTSPQVSVLRAATRRNERASRGILGAVRHSVLGLSRWRGARARPRSHPGAGHIHVTHSGRPCRGPIHTCICE